MDSAFKSDSSIRATPVVPGFDLVREIGRGGYGIVYLARKVSDGAFFAAKVVYRDMFEDAEPYLREWAGIQNFRTLNCHSPFLLDVVELFKSPDETFFCCVMELADDASGEKVVAPATYKPRTLKQEIEKSGRRQRLSAKRSIEIGLALARGLQTLHNNRLVHRDVKPSNILFVCDTVKLGDVGLVIDEEASLTKFTPHHYAAPEDEHATRADIYGFGKVLYEMCIGLGVERFPSLPTTFKDWDDHAICLRLNRVIAKACAVELRDRYASCQDIIEELEAIRDGRKGKNRSKWLPTAATVAVALLAVGALALWTARHPIGPASPSQAATTNPTVPSSISLINVPLAEGRWPIPSPEQIASVKQRVITEAKQRPIGATFLERQTYISSEIDNVRQRRDPIEVYAYLQWLEELSLADADHTTALRVADELSRRFRFDAKQMNALKANVMEVTVRAATTPWHWTGVGKGSTRLGFRFLAMDDFENANRMLKAALASVARADNPLIGTNALFLQKELLVAEPWFQKISQHVVKLQSRPKDADASTECGKYLCFAKNAWPQGLALLQNGEGDLADLARQELRTTASPEVAVLLADAWLKAASKKDAVDRRYFSQRAAYWYGVAAATQTDPSSREIAQRHRQQLLEQYPPSDAVVRIALKSAGNSKLVITAQAITLTSSRGVEDVHVNWYRWGTFKAGGPDIHPNNGETRYLPAHVDFTRAKLAKQHTTGQSTAAKFSTFTDRVEIDIAELPIPTTFEWEISL